MGITNFLVQLTSFIRREREIIDVRRLLFSAHLVTLTGMTSDGVSPYWHQVEDTFNKMNPEEMGKAWEKVRLMIHHLDNREHKVLAEMG